MQFIFYSFNDLKTTDSRNYFIKTLNLRETNSIKKKKKTILFYDSYNDSKAKICLPFVHSCSGFQRYVRIFIFLTKRI